MSKEFALNETSRKVGIIGLGYVGLPLTLEFCDAGYTVTGVDIDEERVETLLGGKSYIGDVPDEAVRTAMSSGRFSATTDISTLRDMESITICVPTPLGKTREPDVSSIVATAEALAEILEKGQIVVLESTVYPGATEELVAPILESSGLKAGEDFFLAFSPERIDPGNKSIPVNKIPKIIGGINEESTRRAAEVYEGVFESVVIVGSTREAEMSKLLENTFRAVNIGLVNELAVMSRGMGIDIWKVIDAAATKPFGFMPFYPGPGWGGHCIPVDPFYLTWRARADGYESGFIEQAGRVNTRMPAYVVERVSGLLNEHGMPIKGSKILLLGVAYKRDVGDVRESPALDVAELLLEAGATLAYHDPHVPETIVGTTEYRSVDLAIDDLKSWDCVVIVTDHEDVDYEMVCENSRLVFDTRNVTGRMGIEQPNVVKL
jgi:UDP-N-acetyl-D-glucosamine dehydrogenase